MWKWQWWAISKSTRAATHEGPEFESRDGAVKWMKAHESQHDANWYFLAEPVLRTVTRVIWGDDAPAAVVAEKVAVVCPIGPDISMTERIRSAIADAYPRPFTTIDATNIDKISGHAIMSALKSAGLADRVGIGMYMATDKLLRKYGREPVTEEQTARKA